MSEPVDKPVGSTFTKHFVATALIVRNDRILLVHHRKIGLWLPPGGHVEAHEDPVEAMHREVREETGLDVTIVPAADLPVSTDENVRVLPPPHHVQVERIAEGPHDHIDLVYLCEALPGIEKGNAESLGLRWFTLEDLRSPEIVQNVRYYAQKAIEEVAAYHSSQRAKASAGSQRGSP